MTEASDAGLASVEHLFQVWHDTSSREEELRRAITAVPIAGGEYNGWLNKMHPYEYAAARSFDRHKAARVFARLARTAPGSLRRSSCTPSPTCPATPR